MKKDAIYLVYSGEINITTKYYQIEISKGCIANSSAIYEDSVVQGVAKSEGVYIKIDI
jgi:hypothetical protein